MSELKNFVYDGAVMGYNTSKWWKALAGTPTASTVYISVNAAEMAMYPSFLAGEVDMFVNVPTAPASGDDKRFGVKSPATGVAAYFDITDDVFKAVVTDGVATPLTATLAFDASWDGSVVKYSVRVEPGAVRFFIKGVHVATIDISTLNFTGVPLSPFVDNNDADAVLLAAVIGTGIQGYFEPIV
jgi:hypothetical protein